MLRLSVLCANKKLKVVKMSLDALQLKCDQLATEKSDVESKFEQLKKENAELNCTCDYLEDLVNDKTEVEFF